MFIDEFDKLYRAPQDVIDSVLDLFRGLKHQRDSYLLQARRYYSFFSRPSQSLVAIGPFSILELTGRSASPFNVREAVQVPWFALDEVNRLFRIFEEERAGLKLDPQISADIHTRTAGCAVANRLFSLWVFIFT